MPILVRPVWEVSWGLPLLGVATVPLYLSGVEQGVLYMAASKTRERTEPARSYYQQRANPMLSSRCIAAPETLPCREQSDDPAERAVQAEASKFGDILRLDSTDTYADLSSKTLKLFGKLPDKFRADFYFKVDDDVIVNVPALIAYLEPRRQQGNLYMVR